MLNSGGFEAVYHDLKEHLENNSEYCPDVNTTLDGDIFPKVVIDEADNSLINKDRMNVDSVSLLSLKIDIYAKSKTVKTKKMAGRSIARELRNLCSEICEDKYHMRRMLCKPTPNVDTNIYRITMMYTKKQSDTRCHFY